MVTNLGDIFWKVEIFCPQSINKRHIVVFLAKITIQFLVEKDNLQ